jgi:hypothetical protein
MRHLVTLVLGTAGLACSGLEAQGATAAPLQCSFSWSPPDTLRTLTGLPVHIDRPIGVARQGRELLLIGLQVLAIPTDSTSRIPDPATLLGGFVGSRGVTRLVERPPFLGATASIWLLPSPKGYSLVWGVPRDSSRPSDDIVTSVWSAEFDGTRWSAPERAMAARRITWWPGTASVISDGSRILVAAPAVDSSGAGILTALRSTNGWSTRRIPIRSGLTPRGVALLNGRSGPLLFYDDQVSKVGEARALYVRRSAPASLGWGDERMVHQFSPGGMNWPHAVRTSDQAVHVIFAFTREDQAGESVVRLSSADLRQWRAQELPLNARMHALAVESDAESILHIVMQTGLSDGLTWTRSSSAGFSDLQHLGFGNAIGAAPNLVALGRDTLVMSWTTHAVLDWYGRRVPYPVTVLSRGARSCR